MQVNIALIGMELTIKGSYSKSGIYLLQLKVKSISGNYYNKEIKVVLTK